MKFNPGRRKFIREGTAIGVGATALAGVTQEGDAAAQAPIRWDRTADVVIVGAGASGLPAAIMARDAGATVIVLEANHDIGGHAMLRGGRGPLGGGTRMQKKKGIVGSAGQGFLEYTKHKGNEVR